MNARSRIIAAMVLTYMLFGILLNSVGTVILQSIATLGQTKESAAILEAFKDLPIAITSFLVASFLPRIGYRRAMIVGTSAVTLACLAMPMFPHFWMVKLLFVVTGISFALVKVSVYSTIGLVAEDAPRHASLTNTIEGMFMVGVLSGYWIFGAFIDEGGSLGWLNVYWLLAAISAAVALLLLTTRIDESAARSAPRPLRDDFASMVALLALPLVIVYLASAFLYVLVEQAIGTWLPTFNNEVLHLPQAMSVQAASIFAAALAIGRLSAGVVLRRVGWYPLVNLCIVAVAALILVSLPMARGVVPSANPGWSHAPLAAFVLPVLGLFLAPIYPAINSAVLVALPKPQHAAMTGLLVVFSALGGTTGSFITGRTFAAFGGDTAFYLALIPLSCLIITLFVFRRFSVNAG